MIKCPTSLIYEAKPANQCGVTGAMFVRPLVRINGIPQDLPPHFKLDPCFIGAPLPGSIPLTSLSAGSLPANVTLVAGNFSTLATSTSAATTVLGPDGAFHPLPVDLDVQNLTLTAGAATLAISGGNTVNLPVRKRFAESSAGSLTFPYTGTKYPDEEYLEINGVLYGADSFSVAYAGNVATVTWVGSFALVAADIIKLHLTTVA